MAKVGSGSAAVEGATVAWDSEAGWAKAGSGSVVVEEAAEAGGWVAAGRARVAEVADWGSETAADSAAAATAAAGLAALAVEG